MWFKYNVRWLHFDLRQDKRSQGKCPEEEKKGNLVEALKVENRIVILKAQQNWEGWGKLYSSGET